MSDCNVCGAQIRFVRITLPNGTGRSVPVEPNASHHRGGIAARPNPAGKLYGYPISRARPLEPGYLRYTAHRTVCNVEKKPLLTAQERTPSLFDRNRTTPKPGPPRPRKPEPTQEER